MQFRSIFLCVLGLVALACSTHSPNANSTAVGDDGYASPTSTLIARTNPNKMRAPRPATNQQVQGAASKGCEPLYLMSANEADALARMRQRPGSARSTSSQSPWTNVDDMERYGWSETFGGPVWAYLGIDRMLQALRLPRAETATADVDLYSPGGSRRQPPAFGTVPWLGSFNVLLRHDRSSRVNGVRYKATGGNYAQLVYPEAGLIVPYYVYSPRNEAYRNRIDGNIVPLERYSDVLALEYKRLCNPQISRAAMSNFRYYLAANVENYEMWAIALAAINRKGRFGTNIPVWPGVSFDMGSEEAKAVLASPIALSTAWMLINHKRDFRMKTVSRVVVFRNEGSANRDEMQPYPTILFEIVDASGQHCSPAGQCCCPRRA